MAVWAVGAIVFTVAQFFYYLACTPERNPRPIKPSRFDGTAAAIAYGLAYGLSLMRLPFAILPYGLKLVGALILKRQYTVSHYAAAFEAFRMCGEIINWIIGFVIIEQIVLIVPALKIPLYASIFAETLRLFTEKGQMVFSVCWQSLPHRRIAQFIQRYAVHGSNCIPIRRLLRYCHYYILDDEQRIQYILSALRAYAAADPEMLAKLAYLSTLRIVASTHGLRGGHVRDVAQGEVFIHQQWTTDPWLLLGQALRRTPWLFDPRYLRRPFYYRSQSNRLSTMFVLMHARCCPTYALYQFGHEIKSARYDFFYRLLRWLKVDIEPKIQADGTFPFDQGISWLKKILFGTPPRTPSLLWRDEDVLTDVRQRIAHGEAVQALNIARQYSYPLKYVEEVLLALLQKADDFGKEPIFVQELEKGG